MKKCPHCAEKIQNAAVKCKHCKTDLGDTNKTSTKPIWFKKPFLIFCGIVVVASALGAIFSPSKPAIENSKPTIAAPAQSKPEPAKEMVLHRIGGHGEADFIYVDPVQAKDLSGLHWACKSYAKKNRPAWAKLLIWSNRKMIPKKLPMSDAQLNHQVAGYDRNVATNLDRFFLMKNGSRVDIND